MAVLGAYVKQPDEVENYTIQYDKNFSKGERITEIAIKTEPEDLEIVNQIFENGEIPYVRVWLGGGINKTVYKTTVTVHTTQGRILQDEFKVKIKEF